MAVKIGDVTIRIGASTKELEADLRKAERALSASSKRFTDFGTKMTLGLTVPIAAAGAAALQSFGDFERLQNALIAITGDASIAAEQFERLKVIAEAPGLALPQVVKASASLQAVGLSAQQAEETIKQYGNAVARSGGGAAEFDGAVLALTQIASKGKISAEELNQLGERIFEIRPALQAAFGTSNSEELQKLGISAQDFIARTTAELGKLERVQGGLSNSFENFRDSVQGSLATLGKAISDSIDFPAILNGISDAIKSVTNAFNDLSPEQKRFAVVFAGLAALIGPAVFAYGQLTKAYGLLRVEYYRVVAAALAKVKAELLAKGATEAAEKATITSTLAIRASLAAIAPYLLAIGALVAVAYGLSKAMDKAGESINVVTELNQQASESVATEKAQTQALIGVINDQTKSINDKKGALEELKKINPDYFGDLDIERDGIKKINDQYTDYIANITKAAKAKIGGEKLTQLLKDEDKSLTDINEINKQIVAQTEKLNKARQNTSAIGAPTGGTGAYSAVLAIEQQISTLKKQRQELIANQEQIGNNIKETENYIISNTNLNNVISGGGGGGGGKLSSFEESLKKINNELTDLQVRFEAGLISPLEFTSSKAELLKDKIDLLVVNGFKPLGKDVSAVRDELNALNAETQSYFNVKPLEASVTAFQESQQQLLDNIGKAVNSQKAAKEIGTLEQRLKDAVTKNVPQPVIKPLLDTSEIDNKFESFKEKFGSATDTLTNDIAPQFNQIAGQLSAIFSQRQANLDQYYENEKLRIEQSTMSEEQKAAAIKALDEDTLKKKRAIARKQAAIDKASAIFSVTVNTAQAIVKALTAGPIVGPILAGVIGALAAAQIAAIAAAPLPSLAIGTDLVKSDGLAMIHKGEAIVPADVAKGGFNGSGGIAQVSGRIQGTDIILVSDYAMNFKNRIR